jgi:hypothetical protein
MAITTYSELKTAIATWIARSGDSDISGNAADFVALAEARMNRLLGLRAFRADTALTGTVDSRELSLPNDFVEPYSLHLTTGTAHRELTPRHAAHMDYSESSGEPDEWAIKGTKIHLNRPCDEAHTFNLHYRQRLALSDASPMNWLLTNHPDVYLWGALLAAGIFEMDAETGMSMKALFDEAMAELGNVDSRSQGIAEAQFDAALLMGRRSVDLTNDA